MVCELLADLELDPRVQIAHPEPGLWRRGFYLYADRRDKAWSLTDCISFVVMQERAIADALTGDHHFEQAGFRALLK
jgi:predicted nucleic acid-binding protein